MFKQTPRIGFACKIQKSPGTADKALNTSSTTIAWLAKQTKQAAYTRLYALAKQNLIALEQQILFLAKQPQHLRMFRMTSDLLTAYTHDDYLWCYQEPEMQLMLERGFAKCGELARQHDIRLSFHPGQFCVLASDSDQTVENSIYEFEYHVDIARWMGYGQQFQDFKINVHIGGKRGPDGIKQVLKKLSREARNCLTIENAEFSWGLQHSLELKEYCALVLDIHHHLLATTEYIRPDDWRVKQVIDSWRGVRPTLHYSVSREDCLKNHNPDVLPDIKALIASGLTKSKLRAHSDYYWNTASNDWALSFLDSFDIMLEAKEKNIAREQFVQYALDTQKLI